MMTTVKQSLNTATPSPLAMAFLLAITAVTPLAAATPHSADAHSVPVTREQVEKFGIKVATATTGTISRDIRIPGEIRVNSDRVSHVVPRSAGVVRQVGITLGAHVAAGETLAQLESTELAEAKLDFYAKESEVACCEIELPRAEAIFANVAKLIALLRSETAPTEEAIRKLDGLEMGAYRGALLKAHAAYRAADSVHRRELELRKKQVSSEQDLLDAETSLKQARAELYAMLDTARYETLIAYTDAARDQQVAAFNAAAAEKSLRLSGGDDATVASLRALVPRAASLQPCLCDEPDCKKSKIPSAGRSLGRDERFAWYALQSPVSGTIIEKHIALGESLDTTSEVFTIADLSTVWVDLAVSQEDISLIREGLASTIRLPDGTSAKAPVHFVSPIVDSETRTAMARVTVDNSSGGFRPGTFVQATIHIPSQREAVVVPKATVQLVNDHPCVFVWKTGAFELRQVVTGAADSERVEITSGLEAGEKVAAVNAFHLKAQYIKSAAGDVGGCQGHSH